MYNVQFIPTYMFYDMSLCSLNPISSKFMEEKTNSNEKKEINQEDIQQKTTTIHYTPLSTNEDSDSDNDSDLNIDDINDLFTSKYLYENEILHAFHMNNFDEQIINLKIKELYDYIHNIRVMNESANSLLDFTSRIASDILSCSDEHSGFILLFSYQFFHITHLCIIDLLNEDTSYKISQINMDALIKSTNLFTNS
jgi:hypothetical protein